MIVPVIAIDGPTASGKGTIAQRVADALGFHYLDSGALYRIVAWLARRDGVPVTAPAPLAELASSMQPQFVGDRIEVEGADITTAIRDEEISRLASQLAAHGPVRSALLQLQRAQRRPPGLVAEGRDMGTVVFPDAALKIFLTASVEARADRRYKQLIEKGFPANITTLAQDLKARDRRDAERSVAPLKPAPDARQLDSSGLAVEQVVDQVLQWFAQSGSEAKRG